MTTRLDLTLQKFPKHEEAIRLLASRDPSGNLKYLDWSTKIIASGQALAPEVADIVDLFHVFNGRQLDESPGSRIRSDIYSYRPQDLARLRDGLLKLKRAQDRKRKKREKLYKLDDAIEVDVVYDAPDLVVRHVKNKAASCHYGLGTKWCISMLRERHFEHYETNNATFFFFERKAPLGDEFDKVALMVPRNVDDDDGEIGGIGAFTALDRRVDMMKLAKVHGSRVFDIFREVHERSERYPGSAMYQVLAGTASAEHAAAAWALVVDGKVGNVAQIIETVCCNDAAPAALLQEVWRRSRRLFVSSWKRESKRFWGSSFRGRRRRSPSPSVVTKRRQKATDALVLTMSAALYVHPNTPTDIRAKAMRLLKRNRVKLNLIERTKHRHVGISYEHPKRCHRRLRRLGRRYRWTLTGAKRLLAHGESTVRRARKKLKKLEQEAKIKAKKKGAAKAPKK